MADNPEFADAYAVETGRPLAGNTFYTAGTSYWRAGIVTDCDTGSWTAVRSLMAIAPPQAPVSLSPDDESHPCAVEGVQLDWSDVPGVESYELHLSPAPKFAEPVIVYTGADDSA